MIRFIAWRLASVVPLLLLISLLVYVSVTIIPGDVARSIAGADASPEDLARIREQFHLDEPVLVQYWYWLLDALRLDLGESRYTSAPVIDELSSRLPVTLSLIALASVIALVISLPTGALSAVRPRRIFDRVSNFGAGAFLAIPNFLLAFILLLGLGVEAGWFPILGYENFTDSPWGWLQHMTLPALALAATTAGVVHRQLRGAMIDNFGARYVTAAWARGGTRRSVITKHVLRNASVPALTAFGVQLAYLLGGTVIVEQIFSIPGMGTYMITAINGRDVVVIQACVLVFAVCQVLVSLIIDVLYGYLNPKLRVAA